MKIPKHPNPFPMITPKTLHKHRKNPISHASLSIPKHPPFISQHTQSTPPPPSTAHTPELHTPSASWPRPPT